MIPKKRLSLVLMLCLLAAFAAQAVHAEETGAAMLPWERAGGFCAPADLGKVPEPMVAACVCVPGGSFNCSGTGATCSAATSSFLSDCDDEADLACTGLDGVCFVTIIEQNACQWTGSQYEVTGRARTRCRACS